MSEFDYEKSVKRLEEIVESLESGELSLEKSIELFGEGTRIAADCYEILKNAEQKITEMQELE